LLRDAATMHFHKNLRFERTSQYGHIGVLDSDHRPRTRPGCTGVVYECANDVGKRQTRHSQCTRQRAPQQTRGGNCVPPTVIYLPYRVSGSTLTAVGRSQLLARRPGTHSRILSGIQRATQTILGVYLKRTCSRVTSESSALGGSNDYALYKSTHSVSHNVRRRHRAMTLCALITQANSVCTMRTGELLQ